MLEKYADVLSISEVREILSIGRNTVYALCASGKLPALRVGKQWRVSKEALLGYLRQHQIPKSQ